MTTTPADPGDGSPWERGSRRPRPVRSDRSQVALVGSEGRVLVGRLQDPLAPPTSLQAIYTEADQWPPTRHLLRLVGSASVAVRSGLPGPTVRHAVNGQRTPSPATAKTLTVVALDIADELLAAGAPEDPVGRLGAAVDCLGGGGLRNCAGCGATLSGRKRQWCSEACRKRVERGGASRAGAAQRRVSSPSIAVPAGLKSLPNCPYCGTVFAGRAQESHRCGVQP